MPPPPARCLIGVSLHGLLPGHSVYIRLKTVLTAWNCTRLGTLGCPALCFFSAGSSRSSSSSLGKPMLGELQVELGGARGGNSGGALGGASVINGFGGNG
eukprot:9476408-Pyramimonas_sp.AAC.1